MEKTIYLIIGTVFYAEQSGAQPPVIYGAFYDKKQAEDTYQKILSKRHHKYDLDYLVFPEPQKSGFDSEIINIYEYKIKN